MRPPAADLPRDADLEGRHIVITSGGTAEPIDPVRFIGNRSSGRMGAAVADAALDRGARVTLIAGTVTVPLPDRATVVRVGSTAQMRAALLTATGTADPDGRAAFDALVMAAAVADFRPTRPAETKLVRGEHLTLELEPTPDLLAEVARIVRGRDSTGAVTRRPHEPAPILVGFAAETGSLDRAADKLARKGVDLLVANDVAEAGSGFGTETNRVTIFQADGPTDAWPMLTKREVADRLLDLVAARLDARDEARQTSAAPDAGPADPEPRGAADRTPRQTQETGR
jgi:phosphopantothenoylcysteine decarboxylase/phosphopantothenate--cysteine ligase